MKISLVFFYLIISTSIMARAEVRFANVFNNRCVLQREMPLPIWGWADPAEKVTVALRENRKETVADKEGRWQVTFDPQPAGGPFVLSAQGTNKVELNDVLIGEVWIGVGQSNMMMGVGATTGGKEALSQPGDYPRLRMSFNFGNVAKERVKEVGKAGWGAPNGSSSATSFYFALKLYDHFKGEVPVGILNYSQIRPAEAWIEESILAASPLGKELLPPKDGWDSTRLYNGVVHPLVPLAFRGVLYYQGEMNAGGSGKRFEALMPMVIESWRKAFGRPDLPFLFVQLPGYFQHKGGKDQKMDMDAKVLAGIGGNSHHGFVGVREAQRVTFKQVPHCGMAVTIDVGEPWDIHPRNKRPVGERLFLQALRVAYGDTKTTTNGPFMERCETRGGEVVVGFDTGGSPLELKDGKAAGFELAGADGIFHPAQGRIEGDTMILRSEAVSEPVMARYAWAGFSPVSLFNGAGLPAAPFQWIRYEKIAAPSRIAVHLFEGDPAWKLEKGAAEGEGGVVRLPTPGAAAKSDKFPFDGFFYDSPVVDHPGFIRPGMAIGHSVDVATEGAGSARILFRLAAEHNFFDRPLRVESPEFATRRIVFTIPQKIASLPGHRYFRVAHVASKDSGEGTGIRFRQVSPLTIIRPELGWDGPKEIRFGTVAVGAKAESPVMTVRNQQTETLPMQMDGDETKAKSLPTVLYGLAGAPPTGKKLIVTDHIGAVLIGEGARHFRIRGERATGDGTGLSLSGADGKPGLAGGSAGEEERFTVTFEGSDKPETCRAVLRIVTQAANTGTMSRGLEGEPRANLFYLDIPISAEVR